MNIKDILATKGTTVYSTTPDATLAQVAKDLVEHKVGALLVSRINASSGEPPVGIVTERDLLYHSAESNLPLSEVLVSEVMTSKLITGSPEDAVEIVMGLMTEKRIRHLPVLSEGRLVGIVSIGDIVKAQHSQMAVEHRFMKNYIRG